MTYRLLTEFENLFRGTPYKHRNPTLGDWVALHLYEDLVELDSSHSLADRIRSGSRVLTSRNRIQGIRHRRGDGTFGEIVPGERPIFDPDYQVGRARTATVEIGVEVKILAKAMGKQIDRVCSDLRNQAQEFRRAGGHPTSMAIVGINHAERYKSFEGERTFPTTGKDGFLHPVQEASEAAACLVADAKPSYDHFLILRFKATNEEPYPFEWVDEIQTIRDYGAILVRISAEYDRRFPPPTN